MRVGGGVSAAAVCGTGDSSRARTFAISVGAHDVTGRYHLPTGLDLSSEINGRGTARFAIVDGSPPTRSPALGARVRIMHSGSTVFAGSVDEVQTRQIGVSPHCIVDLVCVDYHQIADRWLVNDAFESTSAGDIVSLLLSRYLSADGIRAGRIDAGAPSIDRVVYPWRTVASCLDNLCELSGDFFWNIDVGRRLNFHSARQRVAPWNISAGANPTMGLARVESRHELTNRMVLEGGSDTTSVQVDIAHGDGERRSFPLRFELHSLTSIEVDTGAGFNSVPPEDIGLRGVDEETRRWYYEKGSDRITQDSDESVLAAAHRVRATYVGSYRVVSIREDTESIQARQLAEGGSGVYYALENAPEIESSTFAQLRCDGLLTRRANPQSAVTYSTDRPGLSPGQLQQIDTPAAGGSAREYLITRVSASDRGDWSRDKPGVGLRYSVTASQAGRYASWVEFWRLLFERSKRLAITTSETIDKTHAESDAVQLDDDVSVDQTNTLDPWEGDPYSRYQVGPGRIGHALIGAVEHG